MKDNATPISCFNCEQGVYRVDGKWVNFVCLKNHRNHKFLNNEMFWEPLKKAMEGHASFCRDYEGDVKKYEP